MLPLEYITVGGLLRRTTALFPNRMAVIDREKRAAVAWGRSKGLG